MNRYSWLWPAIILSSAAAIGFLAFSEVATPLRPLIAFWFLLLCPGMAFVRLLQVKDVVVEWTLAIALSLALDAIVATFMLYAGLWDPQRGLILLIGLSMVGATLQAGSIFREATADLRRSQPGRVLRNRPAFNLRFLRWVQAVTVSLILFGLIFLVSFRMGWVDARAIASVLLKNVPEQVNVVPTSRPVETVQATELPILTPQVTPVPVQIKPINLQNPMNKSLCAWNCSLTFSWTYEAPLDVGQQFAVYLFSADMKDPTLLGSVNSPVTGSTYELALKGDTLNVPPGDYYWLITLQQAADGQMLTTSSLRSLIFLGYQTTE